MFLGHVSAGTHTHAYPFSAIKKQRGRAALIYQINTPPYSKTNKKYLILPKKFLKAQFEMAEDHKVIHT